MIGVREFVEAKLQRIGVRLGSGELDALMIDAGFVLSGEPQEYTTSNANQAKAAVLSALSDILLMPDIAEGDLSIKYDRAAIATYCATLRTELGIADTTAATVTDKSYLW